MKPRIFKSILLCKVRSHYNDPQCKVLNRISHNSCDIFSSSCIQAVQLYPDCITSQTSHPECWRQPKLQAKSDCWKNQNLIFGYSPNSFQARSHNRKKLILSSSYLSVCLRVSAWFPSDGFQWNLMLGTSEKSVEEIQIWLKSVINIGHFTWRPK